MKNLEFVKEVNNGDTFYYTKIDGMFILDTASLDKKVAYKKYLEIVEKEKQNKAIEILESIKI